MAHAWVVKQGKKKRVSSEESRQTSPFFDENLEKNVEIITGLDALDVAQQVKAIEFL